MLTIVKHLSLCLSFLVFFSPSSIKAQDSIDIDFGENINRRIRGSQKIGFEDLPQEWQLDIGKTSEEIIGEFFEANSEQQKAQSEWSPEKLGDKILILRGQKFLNKEYLDKVFQGCLKSFYPSIEAHTPTLEQTIFTLLFKSPSSFAVAASVDHLNKLSVWCKYGFVLHIPSHNIHFSSSMDSQLDPIQQYKTAQGKSRFKDILVKRLKSPMEVITSSSSHMNNEIGFVPAISIDGTEYKIKLAGFYIDDRATLDDFKFYPPQFCNDPDSLERLKAQQMKSYTEHKIVSLEERQQIEAMAQRLKLPVYTFTKQGVNIQTLK